MGSRLGDGTAGSRLAGEQSTGNSWNTVIASANTAAWSFATGLDFVNRNGIEIYGTILAAGNDNIKFQPNGSDANLTCQRLRSDASPTGQQVIWEVGEIFGAVLAAHTIHARITKDYSGYLTYMSRMNLSLNDGSTDLGYFEQGSRRVTTAVTSMTLACVTAARIAANSKILWRYI